MFSEMSKEIFIVIWTPMSLKFWHCVMYESMTLLMHHDILFIIEIGLCQFSHFFHVIVLYAYLCLFKHCLYAHILCISCKFVYTYHTFIPQLVFVLILLDSLSFMIKNGRNFWTLVHMHRRRYIDRGRHIDIYTLLFSFKMFIFFVWCYSLSFST